MSIEKMRAEFEAWATKRGLSLVRYSGGMYVSDATLWASISWQASRAALVVELPEQSPETPFSRHMVMDSSSVIEAIEVAGVRVKS